MPTPAAPALEFVAQLAIDVGAPIDLGDLPDVVETDDGARIAVRNVPSPQPSSWRGWMTDN